MARNVYSVCFIAVSGLSGAATYTVAADQVALVEMVDAYQGAHTPGGSVRFQDVDTGGTIWYDRAGDNQDSYMSWRGRQAFTAGQTFQVSQAVQVTDFRVCGYLLSAP